MDIEKALTEEAQFIARAMEGRVQGLEQELREVEERKAELERQLRATRGSPNRLANYQPRIGQDFQCPRCWIENEFRVRLSTVPGTDEIDIMHCHNCGADWEIPLQD
jgi:hypothetical protein